MYTDQMEIVNKLASRYNGEYAKIRPTSGDWFRYSFSSSNDVDKFVYDLTFTKAAKAVIADGTCCFVLV